MQLAEAVTSALTGTHRRETGNQESSTNVSKLSFTIPHVSTSLLQLIVVGIRDSTDIYIIHVAYIS